MSHRTTSAVLLVGIACLDLATKAAAFALVPAGQRTGPVLPLLNEDALLGIVRGSSSVLMAAGILVLAGFWLLCRHLAKRGRISFWVPPVLAAGAIANLIDRSLSGAVHDWLILGDIVVNLADLAVVVAVAGYAVGMLRTRPRPAETTSLYGSPCPSAGDHSRPPHLEVATGRPRMTTNRQETAEQTHSWHPDRKGGDLRRSSRSRRPRTGDRVRRLRVASFLVWVPLALSVACSSSNPAEISSQCQRSSTGATDVERSAMYETCMTGKGATCGPSGISTGGRRCQIATEPETFVVFDNPFDSGTSTTTR